VASLKETWRFRLRMDKKSEMRPTESSCYLLDGGEAGGQSQICDEQRLGRRAEKPTQFGAARSNHRTCESSTPMPSVSRLASRFSIMMTALFLTGCAGSTKNLRAIEGFDAARYMGVWYEIARLPNSFEKGLVAVKAEYTLTPDGTVEVFNSGHDPKKKKDRGVRGRAKFTGSPDVASLKVTFFWPFYAPYKVIDLDKDNYSRALVTSGSRKYLWLLFRNPNPSEAEVKDLIARAEALGFDVSRLERIDQSRNISPLSDPKRE